jgi:trimethylamine--corrinoid protein Co-methyltransferase
MSNLLVAMSGANYIHDSAGLMEADLTVSYEKLVMDNEILGMCQRVLRGIEVNDDTLATDLIIEKGPGQDYLVEEHTIRYMRDEFFMPELANRQKRAQFDQREDALARARRFVENVRRKSPEGLVEESLRTRLSEDFPEILPEKGSAASAGASK